MKKMCISLSLVILLLGSLSGYLFYRVTTIERDIRYRTEDSETLEYMYQRLLEQHTKLKQKKAALAARLKEQEEAVKEYRDAFKKEQLRNIRRKISGVSARSAPLIGMVTVAGSTLEDAATYCMEMERVAALESRVLGYVSDEGFDNEICSDDLNVTAEKIRQDGKDALQRYLSVKKGETVFYWKEQINNGMETVAESGDPVKRYMFTLYDDFFKEMNVTSEERRSLDETFKYWQAVFGL